MALKRDLRLSAFLLAPGISDIFLSFKELDISGILVTTQTLEVLCQKCRRLEVLRMGAWESYESYFREQDMVRFDGRKAEYVQSRPGRSAVLPAFFSLYWRIRPLDYVMLVWRSRRRESNRRCFDGERTWEGVAWLIAPLSAVVGGHTLLV